MVGLRAFGRHTSLENADVGHLLVGHAFGVSAMYAIKCYYQAEGGNRIHAVALFGAIGERTPEAFSIATLASADNSSWLDIDSIFDIHPKPDPTTIVPGRPMLRDVVGKLVVHGEMAALGVVDLGQGGTTRAFLLDLASGRLAGAMPDAQVVVIDTFQIRRKDAGVTNAAAVFQGGKLVLPTPKDRIVPLTPPA